MNSNEVIRDAGTRALGRDVHPNDDVNAFTVVQRHVPDHDPRAATGPSSPTHPGTSGLAEVIECLPPMWPTLQSVSPILWTPWPVTLGQEAGAWASQVAIRLEGG